ncbi:hypothetical protein RND81_12G169100 [Saponaria officinalis]|uniref:Polygalacturonase n=1 Tax=Saponaria officinalis TaxID=3572 RepID=A0AAW1HBN8_SAPOF
MTNFLVKLFLIFLVSTTAKTIVLATSLRVLSSSLTRSNTFDVVKDFGAINDGAHDTTQAFLNAWDAACASSTASKVYVPKGSYLLKSIVFKGNCKSHILFAIHGTLFAHDVYDEEHWIDFQDIDGLRIKGGVLNAKGQDIWDCKSSHDGCPSGAKSLNFDKSKNIIVDGLTSKNSQMFHITINTCQNIYMRDLTITADGDSPNTDGIHLQNSQGITIAHSKINTGDDCISIGPNNQNLWISDIICGPGHGISIGSLGRGSDEGLVVRNVTIKSSTFVGTDNGLRIKTFSSPTKGSVEDIYFLGATMKNVRNPIIIDQNYCPHNECPTGQGSGIQINNVQYKNIRGTSSSKEIVTFDCSPTNPCSGLTLQDIHISYGSDTPICKCNNANWKVIGSSMQPSNCLKKN